MTNEPEQLKGMVRRAIKLGDHQAALIVDKLHELRKMKKRIRIVIRLMQTGRHQDAILILKGLLK